MAPEYSPGEPRVLLIKALFVGFGMAVITTVSWGLFWVFVVTVWMATQGEGGLGGVSGVLLPPALVGFGVGFIGTLVWGRRRASS